MVEKLIELGEDTRQVSMFEGPILCQAAAEGRPRIVQILLDHGTDIEVEHKKNTPLYLAVANRHADCVQLLLERGENPNVINSAPGWTPLCVAVKNADEPCVKLLIHYGAMVNPDLFTFPFSPLDQALILENGKVKSLSILKRILDAGGSIDDPPTIVAPHTYTGRPLMGRQKWCAC